MATVGSLVVKLIANTGKFTAGMKGARGQLGGLSQKAAHAKQATQKFGSAMTAASAKATGFARKVFGLNRALGTASTGLKGMAVSVAGVGAAFTAALRPMLAFIGPLAAIYGMFRLGRAVQEFEQGMQSSLAIMSDVSDAMRAKMEQTAKDVAFATIHSSAEAGKAYYFLASAGMDAAQSVAALPAVAKFAQAGMFDLSIATDLLTDSQMALGLSSKNAEKNLASLRHVGDVLVKANTLANASVLQFAEALTNKAAASARRFGQSVEEVTAVLAAFAARGIKGTEAGTQYDIVMRNLSIKAIENAEAFKKTGIAVFDQTGKMRFLGEIVADLEYKLGAMSDRQKVATLMMLGFTAKTISSTAVLMGASEEMHNYLIELNNAAGTMEDVAAKQMTQFTKGWNKIKAAITEVGIAKLSDTIAALGGALEVFAHQIRGVPEKIDKITESADKLSVKLESFSSTRLGRIADDLARIGKAWRMLTAQNIGEFAEAFAFPLPSQMVEDSRRIERLEAIRTKAMAEPQREKFGSRSVFAGQDLMGGFDIDQTRRNEAMGEYAETLESAYDYLAKLQREYAEFGKTATEKQIMEFEAAGVDSEVLGEIEAWADSLKRATEKQKELEEATRKATQAEKKQAREAEVYRKGLEAKAEQVREALKTPWEKLRDKGVELTNLWKMGFIEADEALARFEQHKADYFEQIQRDQPGVPSVAAMEKGGAAAYTAIIRAQSPELKAAEKGNELLGNIDRNTQGLVNLEAPEIASIPPA